METLLVKQPCDKIFLQAAEWQERRLKVGNTRRRFFYMCLNNG